MSYFYLSSVVLLLLAIIGNYVTAAAELDLDAIPPPLGTCVTSSSDGPVPDDLWATTGIIVDSTKYPPFQKYIETRGIVLAAISEEAVSDVFLQQVATTLNEMIPDDDAYDREQQETMIATMARKRTLIPIVPVEGFGALSEEEFQQMDQIQDTYSSCDMIFELGLENPRQPMEVVEHLLHHLNLIGLHYLLPEQWGMTSTSQLSDELTLSGQQQYFDVAGYEASFPEASDEEMANILLKQYSFWLLATWMDVVAEYGPNDVENEWQLFTPALLEADQPSAWALCENYLKTLLAVPTNLADYGPTAEDLQVAAEALKEWEDQVQQAEAAAMATVAAALEADPLRPLGNCVSTTDDGPIPTDLWSTTEIIVDSTKYPPFQKYIETRGMIFAAISDETISDDFLTKIATTVTQLIPDAAAESATYNRTKQEEMITILAQKRTLIPIVPIGNIFGDLSQEESAQLDQIQDEYSSCDVIIQLAAGDPNQPMEVLKHVLHHVNMIGLNYLLYDQWGMTPQSVLFTNLVEALQQEYFSIPPYQDELGNYQNIALDPIPLQQYSSWLLSTWMDLVVDYGPQPLEVVEEEWQLYTPALLQEQQPMAYALCVDTLTDIFATPTNLPEYATITTTTTAVAAEDGDVLPTVAAPVPPSPTNVVPVVVVPQTLAPTTTPVVVVVPDEEEGMMKEQEEEKELEQPPPEVVAARLDDTGEDEGTTTTNDSTVIVADTDPAADADADPTTLLEEDALLSASSASASLSTTTMLTTSTVLVVMGLTTMITTMV